MTKAATIKALVANITRARDVYYNNNEPEVSDDVFDSWMEDLRKLDPENKVFKVVGAPPVSEWKKAAHVIAMGSQEKVNTPEEFKKWAALHGTDFCVSDKCDGISIELVYAQGKFIRAVTRGDGTLGEDITVNVAKMHGLPLRLPEPLDATFRGEIVLRKSDHQKHFPDYANPRNAASGIAKRLDGRGCEHLTVLTYEMFCDDPGVPERFHEVFEILPLLGFKKPAHSVGRADHVVKEWQRYIDGGREALDYDIDGLVVSVDSIGACRVMGDEGGCPQGQRAFKFPAMTGESMVQRIEWQVGKTGRITPVAVVNPVNVGGVKVTHASLHNAANVKALKICAGAKVLIYRANDVIPQVREVLDFGVFGASGELPPSTCPECSAPTQTEGEYLVCRNKFCRAVQVGRIQMWVAELGLLEWGESIIAKLVEAKLVNTIADLYTLKAPDIAGLDRMGEKSAKNLLDILHERKPLPLETVLAGLSIPNCQTTTASLVVHDGGFDTVAKLAAVTEEALIRIPGIGPVKAAGIVAGIKENLMLIQAIASKVGIKAKVEGKLSGLSFCFTGPATKPRPVLQNMVKAHGGIVKSSVSKGLDYLVMASADSVSTKAKKARELGTTCISEMQFLAMVQGR